MPSSWLKISRYGWFVVVCGVFAGRDACLGGGKRPEPKPPATAAPAGTGTFATPPPSAPPAPPPPG
jgi:hypothetical protein